MGIKAGRNQNPLGLKIFRCGDDDMLKDFHIFLIGAARGQRNINRIPFSWSGTDFVDRSRTRIKRILMGRDEQHGRIVVKAILSAVAVMYVPIDDEDSLCAVLLFEIRRADRDGIEQAKTHCATKRRSEERRVGKECRSRWSMDD